VKPVKLNQLLYQDKTTSLSFFCPGSSRVDDLDTFLNDILKQLQLQDRKILSEKFEKNQNQIRKLISSQPQKAHGFFISEQLQGYMILDQLDEAYSVISSTFHLRPIIEQFFVNPEFIIINLSLYDVAVYHGDFHHLEIIRYYDFEDMNVKSPYFIPRNSSLISYKTVLSLKNIAHAIMEQTQYQSLPVIITGLEDLKKIFLHYFNHNFGVVSHFHEDFYDMTCLQILERCKNFRYAVMDHYSSKLKERLKLMKSSKKVVTDLSTIILRMREGKVGHLILPTGRKLWGKIDFESGEFEIHKKVTKKDSSVDILNELADEMLRQGGKIQVLGPHFFPPGAEVLAILRG
jgi:hypothetical protein